MNGACDDTRCATRMRCKILRMCASLHGAWQARIHTGRTTTFVWSYTTYLMPFICGPYYQIAIGFTNNKLIKTSKLTLCSDLSGLNEKKLQQSLWEIPLALLYFTYFRNWMMYGILLLRKCCRHLYNLYCAAVQAIYKLCPRVLLRNKDKEINILTYFDATNPLTNNFEDFLYNLVTDKTRRFLSFKNLITYKHLR